VARGVSVDGGVGVWRVSAGAEVEDLSPANRKSGEEIGGIE
jgi:hypothetical protein